MCEVYCRPDLPELHHMAPQIEMSKLFPMPVDCCLIQAELIKPGDRVRFRASGADYTVAEVEIDGIGHVRHRTNNGTKTCGYHPHEMLWITRRSLLVAAQAEDARDFWGEQGRAA